MRFTINPITDQFDIVGLGSGVFTETITGNSGGSVPPNGSGNISILGDNASGITTVGNPGTSTLTIFGIPSTTTQIGTTRYATNAEAAAQTIGNAALTPSNITSMFSVSPLPASQGGTGLISPAANSLLITNGASPFTILGTASNGQLPIGSIGSAPVLANITSSDGSVTITNGPGTIDLSTTAFLSGTVTTVGLVSGDLITIALAASPMAYKFHFDVVAYESTTPAALGYAIDATARTTGIASTMVGIPDGDEDEDAVLQIDADWDVVASGNNAILRVFGVTGLTLHWKATGRYVNVV